MGEVKRLVLVLLVWNGFVGLFWGLIIMSSMNLLVHWVLSLVRQIQINGSWGPSLLSQLDLLGSMSLPLSAVLCSDEKRYDNAHSRSVTSNDASQSLERQRAILVVLLRFVMICEAHQHVEAIPIMSPRIWSICLKRNLSILFTHNYGPLEKKGSTELS